LNFVLLITTAAAWPGSRRLALVQASLLVAVSLVRSVYSALARSRKQSRTVSLELIEMITS